MRPVISYFSRSDNVLLDVKHAIAFVRDDVELLRLVDLQVLVALCPPVALIRI